MLTNHVGVYSEEVSFVMSHESNATFAFVVSEQTEEEVFMVSRTSEPMMDVSIDGIVREVVIVQGR